MQQCEYKFEEKKKLQYIFKMENVLNKLKEKMVKVEIAVQEKMKDKKNKIKNRK